MNETVPNEGPAAQAQSEEMEPTLSAEETPSKQQENGESAASSEPQSFIIPKTEIEEQPISGCVSRLSYNRDTLATLKCHFPVKCSALVAEMVLT